LSSVRLQAAAADVAADVAAKNLSPLSGACMKNDGVIFAAMML